MPDVHDTIDAREALLPRVPLPALEDSAARFLDWCAPLLTADELADTEQAVASLLAPGSPGHRLQAALQEHDARPDVASWLDDFWRQRYLGRRDRIALNANFFFLFQDAALGQVERAAELLAATLRYKTRLDAGALPPVVQRGRPLSMRQTRYLFSTTRIPGTGQDTLRSPDGPSPARHVLVLSRGHACSLDVVGPDGEPYALDELEAGLREALALTATAAPPGTSVGHLTTLAREDWAATRQALLDVSADNRATLDVVETALLCLCLDDVVPADTTSACDLLLHGNSANRWFDKALSFVVFADGRAGLNAEHAELDGTTILDLVDDVLGAAPSARTAGSRDPVAPEVRPLAFVLDAPLRAAVEDAGTAFAAYAADTATAALSFPEVGTERIKARGSSPDAFVQLAYQLAHARTKGHVGATYESIATRQYRHGRTEAMRVVTPEVLAFVRAMDDPAADGGARRSAFCAAALAHGERARQCQQGQAPEQHLWELQMLQQRRGAELAATEPLALYTSPGWTTMRDDFLSTSSAPSQHILHFGFGSTSRQCIGVAYVLLPDRFNVYLSTPKAVGAHLEVFAVALGSALAELDELLAAEPSTG